MDERGGHAAAAAKDAAGGTTGRRRARQYSAASAASTSSRGRTMTQPPPRTGGGGSWNRGACAAGAAYQLDTGGRASAEEVAAAGDDPTDSAASIRGPHQCLKSAGATSRGTLRPRPLHARARTSAAAREQVVPTRMAVAPCRSAAARAWWAMIASARSWRESRVVHASKAARRASDACRAARGEWREACLHGLAHPTPHGDTSHLYQHPSR